MAMTERFDFNSLLKLYLKETKDFDKNTLIPFFPFIGKQKDTDELLITETINHEGKLENTIKELILADSTLQQHNTKEELRKFILQSEKVEEKLSFRGNFMLGVFCVLPFAISFLLIWSKFIIGDNIYIQVIIPLIFFAISLYNTSDAWHLKQLASKIKCLRMASQNILDSFSSNI